MTAGRRRCTGDTGSAAVWVLAFGILASAVAAVAMVQAAAVLARHRAETAADLAALAAAGGIGVTPDPCALAGPAARRNGARVRSCAVTLDPSGRSGTVVVRVTRTVSLPVLGTSEVTASARAGRLRADGST